MRRVFKLILVGLLFLNAPLFGVSETQIKAVFLEKFTHLIEWPDKNDKEFVVCVLNNQEFADALQEIYTNKTFKGNRVKVNSVQSKEEIQSCHLLFIGKKTKNIDEVIQAIKNRPILSVSDDKQNTPKDVMITIYLTNNKFKYIINNKSAQDADIKISYLLLKSAQEVIK